MKDIIVNVTENDIVIENVFSESSFLDRLKILFLKNINIRFKNYKIKTNNDI